VKNERMCCLNFCLNDMVVVCYILYTQGKILIIRPICISPQLYIALSILDFFLHPDHV
jgi:hypothetical protein